MRDYVLRVRLSEEEQQALEDFATAKGISMAEAIRDYVKLLMRKGGKA